MSNELLFDAISGVAADWRGRKLNVPLRYFDASNFGVTYRTPVDVVRSRLPANVYPLRWGRNEAVTVIMFSDFPKSDIGGYREIMIGFPVSVERRALPYLGLRSFSKRGGAIFVHQMVLDDQEAIDLGVDIAGYPKRLGEIELEFDSSTIRCGWREDGEEVLSLTAPRPALKSVDKRDLADLITTKGGYVLRSQSVGYTGRGGRVDADSISLEFGAHSRATGLRRLVQGKCLGGRLVFDRQIALSQPLEAWK